MEKAYQHLLDLYKTDIKQFEKEKEELKDKIKKEHALFKYEELIPYPEYDDVEFNKKIFQKKEFKRYKSDVNKDSCTNPTFELSSNQKFIKNFMSPFTPYNGLLLFHEVGVGKTCTAISIAERYFEVYQKRVLVVLSSNIKDNFKKQIFDINKYDIENDSANLCTGLTYPDMIINKHLMKREDIEKKINKIINERYQFIGYKELVFAVNSIEEKIKEIEKDENKHEKLFKQKINELFSDRLIIIDEAHNLRFPADNTSKQISTTFINLLKTTTNVKLVLMTATPMYNDSKEIISMLNLLLTNDKRPTIDYNKIFDKKGNISEEGKKILIEVSRGYVSYMRGRNPYTFPARLYPDINKDKNIISKFPTKDIYGETIAPDNRIKHLKLVESKMSKFQREIYDMLEIDKTNEDIDINDDEEEEEAVNKDVQDKVQLSNITYPHISDQFKSPSKIKNFYGSKGFNRCFSQFQSNTYKLMYDQDIKNKHGEILSYDNLDIYSPKMKRIIDYITKSKGIVFVYSQYYYSGIIPLALALEHIGFVKYNSENIGHNLTVDNKFPGKKRPGYIILSRNKDISKNNDAEIAVAKSLENKDGDLIKVVIVSKIATEGIDFKRIREVHIMEPWFNLSRTEQIIGRAVRTCSHMDLPIEDRNVTIYLHANTLNDNTGMESIDLRMYRIAENKESRIKETEKILQENAVDCNLNKKVLTFKKDDIDITFDLRTSQGIVVKNYRLGDDKEEEIKCSPELNEKGATDDTTFNRVYIVDDIMLYKKYVAFLFANRKSYSWDELLRTLESSYKIIDPEVLVYALDEMIIEKYKVFDQRNNPGYIIYKSDKYIFQYSKLQDLRLTLEEREELTTTKKRLTLDIKALKEHKGIDNLKEIEKSKEVENEEEIEEEVDISQVLKDRYNQKIIYFGKVLNADKYSQQIIDFIIDRLTKIEFMQFASWITMKINDESELDQLEKKMVKSIIDSRVLLFDDDDKVVYMYNYFDHELYCWRTDGKFTKCSPLDIGKLGERYEKIMGQKKADKEPSETIRGLMMQKNNDIKFKLKDEKSKTKGYVCTTTLIDTLKDKIKELDDDMFKTITALGKNGTKILLCDIVELLLRGRGKTYFLRSM